MAEFARLSEPFSFHRRLATSAAKGSSSPGKARAAQQAIASEESATAVEIR